MSDVSSVSASAVSPRRTPAQSRARGAVLVAVSLSVYVGTCAALWRVARHGADAFVVVPDAICRTSAPDWLPPAEIARVNALGESVRGRSILDPELARDLAACYKESPWVSRVMHVRRVFPNRLDVGLAIRRPFAAVERGTGPTVVVDRTGVRLPASAETAGLVRLRGVVSPPPAQGAVWEDARVLDGLRVLVRFRRFLGADDLLARSFQPAAVDVTRWSSADSRPIVELLMRSSGLRVIWGVDMPGGEGTVTGPPAEAKLARLAEELPRIAGMKRRPEYLDVAHTTGAVVCFDGRGGPRPRASATARRGGTAE